jgi:mannose-6-phosphate isomerase
MMKIAILSPFLRVYKKILQSFLRQSPEDRRPWGFYKVLEEGERYKVKRIEVLPGRRLSYQRHQRRTEHWMVVHGEAIVTLNGQEKQLASGQSIDIPERAPHRIANPGTDSLVFIEVQRGEYLEEDDIIRLEDDFGRIDE